RRAVTRATAVARDWFRARGWKPFAFQREVWRAYQDGESGLVHAATGTGKTYAAWLAPLIEFIAERPDDYGMKRGRAAPPLRVLWVTPLRALAADTSEALRGALAGMEVGWTLDTRTGDTTASARARQNRRLPTALVTTPESLELLLSRPDSLEQLASLRMVVVDEWHELMGTKRGVQVELALARLRRMQPALRTWGLSATIGNLDDAKDTLLGVKPECASRIVRGVEPKQVVVDALIPPIIERFPWAGHLGTQMLPQVIEAIEEGESAIVFTNTRSQTEIWYQAILAARPDWAGVIALHHGSLERSKRDWVEAGLRSGALRCVVATSSLDLGVDFSPVDRVLQVGSPKGVARLLQRAGRSGHRPGATSRVTCVPTLVLELVEVAAARDGIASGKVESRIGVERPLDLLVQHAITIAVGGGFTSRELLDEVRTTHAYADLLDDEWAWVLDFITHGGAALQAYPEYSRVELRDGRYVVDNATIARRHRMSIGTIVSDAEIAVHYVTGARIGKVEESFIARLNPGDRFFFGGRALEFVRVRDMKAWVRKSASTKGAIPRWMGTRMPLSGQLAHMLRLRLEEAARHEYRDVEMQTVKPVLEVQRKWSHIPTSDELLIERVQSREGYHLYVFPFEGRLVHEGL
ncbi:MAG TPA: ligase-associated DNA damage response DEXH box helicase, partial [Longimicrobiales bacterium]|nr:ligase-associated DNA damage response DEXH box helicase [Longimicrobiales bacterium]